MRKVASICVLALLLLLLLAVGISSAREVQPALFPQQRSGIYAIVAPSCTGVKGVEIDGPTSGITGTFYTFTATVSPSNASTPITYTWRATDQSDVFKPGEPVTQTDTSFSWDVGGVKHVTITAENCGGSVYAPHTITIAASTCGDPYEPNESFADAYLLDPLDPNGYEAYICHAADEDWFGFEAELGDLITLTLDSLPVNYDLELWDPDQVMVGQSNNDSNAPEQIVFLAGNWSGQYRARVMGVSGAYHETKPYHLTIEVASTAPPTLTVNTTGDTDDGTCDATHCSLREAINAVNAGDAWKVTFNITETDPGFDWLTWTISPTAPLPTITQKIDLDATTQTANRGDSNPNGPEIVLDGGAAGAGHGLVLSGTSASTIEGLTIDNWAGAGVHAQGTIQTKIYGCYIGAGRFGVSAAGNQDGVVIVGGHSAHVGGSETGQGNLISGNDRYGVHLSGTAYAQVQDNIIGVDRTGMAALGNGEHGLYLDRGAEYNTIGGDRDTTGNLISGNGGDGVHIYNFFGDSKGNNKLWGNRIGVNAAMTGTLCNAGHGVHLYHSDDNTVGSTESGQGNLIGGNGCGEGAGHGVRIYFADRNVIAGNWIGAEPGELIHLGNDDNGVSIFESQYNTIGPGNAIAHNGGDGVLIQGSSATRNTITQNSITDNGDLGIDNESGGNTELTPPIITLATTGYVEGAACSRCRVEVFGDPAGEGAEYDGVVTATVSGTWTWYGSPSWGPSNATATATDGDGNTSEFSTCSDEYEPNDGFDQASEIGLGDEIESYVCHDGDEDYFVVSVVERSVISVALEMPAGKNYTLRLYSPDRELLEESVTGLPDTRAFTYTAMTGGNYYVRVSGFNNAHDPETPYHLRVTSTPFPVHMRAWIDEGWIGSPAVYKLIPDAGDGPRDGTWMDVVVEVNTDGETLLESYVVLDVPGDAFGAPYNVYERYCLNCSLNEVSWGDLGGGSYRGQLGLSPHYGPGLYGQLVFRFYIRDTATPGRVVPEAELRYEPTGSAVTATDTPPVVLATNVGALIITSRSHLYDNYSTSGASDLLGEVTQAAQGLEPGTMWAAIYYVDDYSSLARDWDNRSFDTSSESAANAAHDEIDALVEDWVEDAAGGAQYLLILGDDDVIPFYRRRDRCDGDDTESAHRGDYGHFAVDRLIDNDFYLSDNWYGDTNHSGISHGYLELYVGRVIGDSADDMRRLFQNGLAGPEYDDFSPRAVLASWDHNDLHYGAAKYASVREHVEDWGLFVPNDLVDNDDWRESDLLEALRTQYSVMIGGNHGWPYGIAVPPDKVDVRGDEIADVISATAPIYRPFYTFGGCRVGFTLVDDGIVDDLNREGASGFVAGSGITWGFPKGSEEYTEEVLNNFSRRVFNDSGRPRSVGGALRSAKADYGAGWYWSCRDRKAVMQVSLFGVPWMVVPQPGDSLASVALDQVDEPAPALAAPRAAPEGGYVITFTVDASTYTITQPAPGFNQVDVDGFQQDMSAGPLLPARDVSFPLPTRAEVTEVSVEQGSETDLGSLDIPTYIPGVALYPEGRDAEWTTTAAELGVVPGQAYTHTVKNLDTHQAVNVHLFPLTYDAASGQTTLAQQLTVTVAYTTPTALAVTGFELDEEAYAPGETMSAWIEATNVSDAEAVFTATLSLIDEYGDEASVTASGPFTIPAGATQEIVPTAPAPSSEGGYRVHLALWQDGVAVAESDAVAQVVAVQITGFEGPERIEPGETAAFTVTFANYTTATLEADFALDVATQYGEPVAALSAPTQTVATDGQVTATFSWDSARAAMGQYQATAVVTPTGYDVRRHSQLFHVRGEQFVYLPLVLRSDS